MKKGLIVIALILITALCSGFIFVDTNTITSEIDIENLNELISESKNKQQDAHSVANAIRALGGSEEHPIITIAQNKWHEEEVKIQDFTNKRNELVELEAKRVAEEQARIKEEKLRREREEQIRIQNEKWAVKSSEYPAATQIWRYLKEDLGYNDYVCAGIMGNLMAEVGGQTLDIQWWLKGGSYYGMCQWSKRYYPNVWGQNLEFQLDYLRDTIQYELNTYGRLYSKGFNYNSFIAMTNEKEAAYAFAKCYERCNSKYYNIRKVNATKAYNYFVNN